MPTVRPTRLTKTLGLKTRAERRTSVRSSVQCLQSPRLTGEGSLLSCGVSNCPQNNAPTSACAVTSPLGYGCAAIQLRDPLFGHIASPGRPVPQPSGGPATIRIWERPGLTFPLTAVGRLRVSRYLPLMDPSPAYLPQVRPLWSQIPRRYPLSEPEKRCQEQGRFPTRLMSAIPMLGTRNDILCRTLMLPLRRIGPLN
jgi:hypothetical protein